MAPGSRLQSITVGKAWWQEHEAASWSHESSARSTERWMSRFNLFLLGIQYKIPIHGMMPPTLAVGFPSVASFGDVLTDILRVLPSGDSESSQVDNGDKLPQAVTSDPSLYDKNLASELLLESHRTRVATL